MKTLTLFGLLLLTGSAHAASLNVPQLQVSRSIHADYQCPGGKHFVVTYINADNGQFFALLPYQGRTLLLVNGMSADGMRYQAGSVTWWIKGRGATLFDATVDPQKPALEGCTSK